jgi:hypothetical protein
MLVIGMVLNVPPLILYWTVKPLIGGTNGKLKLLIQVVAGILIAGAEGNTTAVAEPLCAHATGPVVPCPIVPQADVSIYLVRIV